MIHAPDVDRISGSAWKIKRQVARLGVAAETIGDAAQQRIRRNPSDDANTGDGVAGPNQPCGIVCVDTLAHTRTPKRLRVAFAAG